MLVYCVVPSSPIRKLVPYANKAKKQGIKVYHLNIGDPDIKTPEVMIDVLKKWSGNPIPYGQSQGELKFLESLVYYYNKLGFNFIHTANIQVITGGSEAISMAFFATCETGDEVIVFEPFYTNYNSYAAVNQIKLIPVRTYGENGFHLPDKKEIEKKISKKTKAILICNPSNPTGTVYSKEEMETLVDLAKKHNLFLISDEVYREFVYDGKKHVSILDYMKKLPKQTILLNSLSKRYSLCGARLGKLVSLNNDVMAGVLRIAQGRLSSGYVDQKIAEKLTEVAPSYFKEVKKEYQKRRDILYYGLKKIKGVFLEKPEGAFYTIVRLPVKNSEDFCKWLLTDFRLNNETVMFAPAAGFYATPGLGKNEVRIAYVLNIHDLKRSIEILQRALVEY
ncbi:aspartate aminotransferase [Candidatus Roizmanbacteria bacterium CG_4_10_14_0_2_um_filter_36_35]|uniref:Aminotransferase n=1 Tax=Candidatus Roizmanbacteria bacterium CG_4_10_14_0_2_um_filter_36_35 TaxID=1974822 RepID=A0A2M7UCP4_9BACT|nr:MAG: aspartate aminotransferase [Candidatus Roizmanbacteria bacterium CG_4_10_14_0_2_um_filter_36_35]